MLLIIAAAYIVMACCWKYEVLLCEMNGGDRDQKK